MSSRIDWRNYDYSDGPPKAASPANVPSTASVGSSHTRDTNPYSKSFSIRRSSPTKDNDDVVFQPVPSVQNRKLPSPTEKVGMVGQPKLTYRPPSSTQTTTHYDLKTVSPMDPVKSPTSSMEQDSTGDIPLKNKQGISSIKQNVTHLKKSFSEEEEDGFNEVWDKAESEWKEAGAIRRIISDDEEDANFVNDGSVASFADMDVMNHVHGSSNGMQPPVSILRNRSDATSSPRAEDDDTSYNSAKKRQHPWDKEFQEEEENVHDKPLDERSLYSDDDEEEEDDKTNLDQYEANADDITGMDDDEAVILKHEQYKMQQQKLQQQQQQKLQYPYHNAVNSDVIESNNRRRRSRNQDPNVEDEEDSIAQVYGDVNESVAIDLLQDRTKQAWSKRNQAAAASVQPVNNKSLVKGIDSRKALVSFQKDTVHEFEPDEREEEASDDSEEATEYTEDDTYYDDDTYAGRSLHSVYTKSYESEAEDLVKDLFLWGSGKATNPGRRELKYKKGYKNKNSKKKDDYDDGTLEDEQSIEDESTLEGSSLVPYQNSNRRSNSQVYDDDTYDGSKATLESLSYSEMGEDGWSMTYNYCEDLLTMIGSVCGIRSVTASKPEIESSAKEIPLTESTPLQTKEDEIDIQSTIENWLDYAADLLFDTRPTDKLAGMDSSTKQALMTLSVNAARIKHQLNNCTYYNANSLDLNKDIKIITIKVGLPIGVVFEESPVACWVKRIFPNGNVAKRSSGGKIEEGDQLASINGNSAIQKNVAEVCKILANTPNPESIELCFIRYIGTIQSAPENQGYEVIDPKINANSMVGSTAIPPSKKFSFNRAKSAPSAHEFSNSSQIPVKKSNSTFSFGRNKQDTSKNITNVSPTDEKKKKKKLFGFLRKKKSKSKSS